MSLGLAAAKIAPLYNLGFVLIALYLFIKLFNVTIRGKHVNLLPWKLIFFAVLVFVVEEVLTVLRYLDIINIPVHINGFFELVIIITFIYALLVQKEYVRSLAR